jgi:2-polyprenyl-3-methyl-5-hydroxy-6-metoxy-1,4-benzoquinol methylase
VSPHEAAGTVATAPHWSLPLMIKPWAAIACDGGHRIVRSSGRRGTGIRLSDRRLTIRHECISDGIIKMKNLIFVTGLAADFGGKPFNFAHYMAIHSAMAVNPGFNTLVYYQYEPTGPYWDLIKPFVTTVETTAPSEIFGNPVTHFAHKADVIRLQALIEHGGVYLDMDTICQRSFEPILCGKTVLGIESAQPGIAQWDSNAAIGLCNATMIAPPGAEFLKIWLDQYRSFDGTKWNEHSVILPVRLARQYPDLVRVEPPESFFWPTCNEDGLKSLFVDDGAFPHAYSIHLWESLSWRYLSQLDYDQVTRIDTAYNRIARRFIHDDAEHLQAIAAAERTARLRQSRATFESIYANNVWGGGSGSGSKPETTEDYRRFLQSFLRDNAIRSVIDFGCGDWGFTHLIDWSGIEYHGYDLVTSVIDANNQRYSTPDIHFSLFEDVSKLPQVDLVICKDVFQHLSNDKVAYFLDHLRSKARLLLVTNDLEPARDLNQDIDDGGWRALRPDQAPFNVPSVIVLSWEIGAGQGAHRKATFLISGSTT